VIQVPTLVYSSRCVGCGDCVDICPSDIMHFDPKTRKAYNAEPDMCWECFNCVKVCHRYAMDVRGYADFVPMGHSISVLRDEKENKVYWKIKYRNGTVKEFVFPIRTTPWGSIKPPQAYAEPARGKLMDEYLSAEPDKLYVPELPKPREAVIHEN